MLYSYLFRVLLITLLRLADSLLIDLLASFSKYRFFLAVVSTPESCTLRLKRRANLSNPSFCFLFITIKLITPQARNGNYFTKV